jgi:hypothetical protein
MIDPVVALFDPRRSEFRERLIADRTGRERLVLRRAALLFTARA